MAASAVAPKIDAICRFTGQEKTGVGNKELANKAPMDFDHQRNQNQARVHENACNGKLEIWRESYNYQLVAEKGNKYPTPIKATRAFTRVIP
jgi:hypothetical protein